jgi:hypothetical protein
MSSAQTARVSGWITSGGRQHPVAAAGRGRAPHLVQVAVGGGLGEMPSETVQVPAGGFAPDRADVTARASHREQGGAGGHYIILRNTRAAAYAG